MAKWLSCIVSIYLYGVFDYMFLSCLNVCQSESTVYRVNPQTIVAWMSRNALLEAGARHEDEVTATVFESATI